MSRTVMIGQQTFPHKKAAKAHYAAMLSAYEPRQMVNALDSNELLALLDHHPNAAAKIGVGVRAFRVMNNRYGYKCFAIDRVDGSITDFSFIKCIAGDENPFQKASKGFRKVVEHYIVDRRDEYFELFADDTGRVRCGITGEMISVTEGHMDHCHPLTFEKLIELFLKSHNLSPTDVLTSKSPDNVIGTRVLDKSLALAFFEFHAEFCVLRFITASENLRLSAKQCDRNRAWQ